MDTDIRMLLKAERENWKKRMVKETKGTYIAIYLGLIFSVFMSAMFGFKYDYSSDDKRVIISLTVFIFVVYQGVTAYVSYVRENGRSVNIFEKYRYIPVDVSVCKAYINSTYSSTFRYNRTDGSYICKSNRPG